MSRTYIAVALVPLLMIPSLLFAECLNYEPDSTLLTGKIVRETFPGTPNYESIKAGDEPETYWLLILDRTFCVDAKTDDSLYSAEKDIKKIQLVFMGNEYHQYENLVGKNVIVRGQLFPMQTGHHHTNVLITVKEIRKNKK